MKCQYKKYFTGDEDCEFTYPECMKQILCIYEDKYHENMLESIENKYEEDKNG